MSKPAPKTECYFLPLSKVEKVAELAEDPGSSLKLSYCKRNLFMLQSWKSVPGSSRTRECSIEFRYHKAIKRAIMTHDWDKLLFLLLKWPNSEHNSNSKRMLQRYDTYLRAYMILMLNHPAAKSQSLLMEHFHMVLGCRHDEDKKALMKILVSLPEKLRVRDSRVREVAEPPTRVESEQRSLDEFESRWRAENL